MAVTIAGVFIVNLPKAGPDSIEELIEGAELGGALDAAVASVSATQ
jgi:hypothetical protein